MARTYEGTLVTVTSSPCAVLASLGTEDRAQAIAMRCGRAHDFLRTVLAIDAAVRILVLAPGHWQRHTVSPMFGVPQTIDPRTIVVAGQDAELWEMIVPPLQVLTPDMAAAVRRVYGRPDGSVAIGAYMDLLPVHEMGHLFVDQAAGAFDFHRPRRWLVELFCNLCLHAYVAREEPAAMVSLETFPRAMIALGSTHLAHRELADFERLYAGMEPPNFVWYLSQLHQAAGRLYDAAGVSAVARLFTTIVDSHDDLSDPQLGELLRTAVHPVAEQVLATWPAGV